MSDLDSLVATRARRPNAGSRLKQLIEIEEQASGVSNAIYSEDDENVQLLFQEDENDKEFEQSAASGSDVEEDEIEKSEKDVGVADNDKATKEGLTSDTELVVNSDEMLSDSDLSASENDDSEGERELQKHEKEKKRRARSGPIIPAIKKPKLATEKPRPKPKPKAKHSELLLNIDRRASSRKSAMRNKEILVQKLKEDETRRAALTPVVRVDEVKLTQEDRLAQAVETERENVLSLHSFLKQEIVKREHQKVLFQQRRRKLRQVIRLLSRETFIAPVDEIEDARHVQDLLDKKKRGRRRKTVPGVPEDPRPGDIDTELPYYKKEMEEKRAKEEKEAAERERVETEREDKRRKAAEEEEKWRLKLKEERESKKLAKEERFKEFENVDITDNTHKSLVLGKPEEQQDGDDMDVDSGEEKVPIDLAEVGGTLLESSQPSEDNEAEEKIEEATEKEETEENRTGEPMEIDDLEEKQHPEFAQDTWTAHTTEPERALSRSNLDEKDEADEDEEAGKVTEPEETDAGQELEKENTEAVDAEIEEPSAAETSVLEDTAPEEIGGEEGLPTESDTAEEKKVTFADPDGENEENRPDAEETEALEETEETEEPEEPEEVPDADMTYRPSREGWVYEGPVQQVSRNHIILMDFGENEYPYLPESQMKTILFGENANLGASRRFKDVKTILKSSIRMDNPYATVKEEKEDKLLRPVTEITEEDAMFEALKRLPRLGVKETFEVAEENIQTEETADIQLRTEAPSGLYLPNGNKKLCLISGKEVRYFDPATGLPYENKDVYKIIKTIEQGLIPWYSIGRDQNTYGGVQMYLNQREGARHAKGVPEGFDGC